jgi:hypothetical protein
MPGATYREELSQLLLPIEPGTLAADVVRELLADLIPVADSQSGGDTL